MNGNISLISMIDTILQEGEVELPVFDQVAQRIYDVSTDPETGSELFCEILSEDPVYVSEVLRMANSSFFSGLAEINTIQEAIVRLGMKQVAALVMSISQKRLYSASDSIFSVRMVTLWEHVSATSLSARWIANKAGFRRLSDQVHIAALLHDLGKLSLLKIIEEISSRENISFNDELIDGTLDSLYCEHGAKLLELWEIPEVLVDVVRNQQKAAINPEDILLAIVRLADLACAKEGISDRPQPELCLESLPETQFLGLDDIAIAELCIAIEDANLLNKDQAKAA